MVDQLEQHLTRFLLSWRREVVRAIWGLVRAALIAFLVVAIAGGTGVTVLIYALGKEPFQPLSLLVYATMGVAALATAAMTASIYFSVAVLRGIERAARTVVAEARNVETELSHALSPGPRLPDHH